MKRYRICHEGKSMILSENLILFSNGEKGFCSKLVYEYILQAVSDNENIEIYEI